MEKTVLIHEMPELYIRRTITTGAGDYVSFALHDHSSYEIFMLKSEKASFYAEGTIYRMNEGDVIIFNNTELHNISFDNSKAYDRFVIHFNPTIVLSFDVEKYKLLNIFTARKNGQNNYIPSELLKQTDFYNIIGQMEKVVSKKPAYIDIYCKTLLIQLIVALNEAKSLSTDTPFPILSNEKIRHVLSYINDNLTEELSLSFLAEEFHMSKSNLCHLFKATTGFSVKQYITYRRIALAQKFLVKGYSALDAAVAAGFNDYSNFYKIFKKFMCKPPKNFK